MIHETDMAENLQEEVVNTSFYFPNRIYIRLILNKALYDLFKGRRLNIYYFHLFGCTGYILNKKVHLKKFDVEDQKFILLGYCEHLKAYKVYNLETNIVKESIHIKFDDKESDNQISELVDSFVEIEFTAEPETSSVPNGTSDALKHVELSDDPKFVAPSDTP